MKVSVVVAAYDEAANIETLVRRLASTLGAEDDLEWELVAVVEGQDGTREILEDLKPLVPGMRLIYGARPTGLGNAFRRGFAVVADDADWVVTLDADLNHQPEEIPRLLARAREERADVLVGSRFVRGAEVEGAPLWKRFLSGSVNHLMRWLYGLRVRDKTSGFRVYRAAVVRELVWRSPGFAFLPEILIRANAAGRRIAEAPIQFTYRREGRSKMAFWPTSLSYLALLRSRFDRLSLALLALFTLAIALRVAVAFPVHKTPTDADLSLHGLCAFSVLRGEMPTFFAYRRIGSLGAHLTAFFFLLFGSGRAALALGPIVVGSLLAGVWYGFHRRLLGRELGLLALVFIALPAPAFLFWTQQPNGYPETLFFCAAVLALAAWVEKRPSSAPLLFTLGLAAGLGWWNSLQTLAATGPAAVWLLWRRPELARRFRAVALAAAGFFLGAAPWWLYNLRHSMATFEPDLQSKMGPARSLEAVADNLGYFFTYSLPELFASISPLPAALGFAGPTERWLRWPVLLIVFAALGWALAAPLAESRLRRGGRGAFWQLAGLVAVAVLGLNVLSSVGSERGLTVRYVLPLYLVVPGALALFLGWVGQRSRALAAGLGFLILVFNLSAAYLPWDAARHQWARHAEADERLIEILERERIDVVVGSYWQVYPINFLSHEEILGLPVIEIDDHYDLAEHLDARDRRWALLGRTPDRLERWAGVAGLEGDVVEAAPGLHSLFLIRGEAPASDPERWLERLRAAHDAR